MFKNFSKIAWRNILKSKYYSTLKIAGLALGISSALLIAGFVWRESRINMDLRNATNQYFLESHWRDRNQRIDITTLGPLAKRLKEDYPHLVANYYRWDGITSVVSKGEKHLREGIQLGDSTILSMFGFKLLHGDSRTALNSPYSVVITQGIAQKYFGRTDVVGETLGIQNFSGASQEFAITGVLEDLNENSVTDLNDNNHNGIFIPTSTYTYFGRMDFDSWANTVLPSYIELKQGVSPEELEQPVRRLIGENAGDFVKQNLTVELVPLTTYYLDKNNGLARKMLYILSCAGFFILLMAVINFVNLSISSSSSRIREIGVRKVLGGLRSQLIIQFLSESVILVLLSTVAALALYPLFQPHFEAIVGKAIPAPGDYPAHFVVFPLVLALFVGLLAGLYPAFALSSLKSVDSIKGKLKGIKENIWLRRSLAGFQFCTAAIVIASAVVVSQQVNYFFSRNLGYNKEFIVSSQVPRDWTPKGVQHMETVRREFESLPGVSSVSLAYEVPNGMNGGQPSLYKYGMDSTQSVAMQSLVTDPFYLDTYEIPLAAGLFFRNDQAYDSSYVVLNEIAVKALGWSDAQDALGKRLRIPNNPMVYTVQGVTKNFHFNSMQQKIEPTIFFQTRLVNTYRYLSFRVRPDDVAGTIASIEKKWASLLPGSSFEYSFMDDTLSSLYKTELQLKKASYTATVLSLVIVLIGVLGLVSLNVARRTKEIGIRKVLGASVKGVVWLFVREFAIILLIAGFVAGPLAWTIMNDWLNDYAYRITLTAFPFVAAVLALGVITLVLIVLQTIRAGLTNPAHALRTE